MGPRQRSGQVQEISLSLSVAVWGPTTSGKTRVASIARLRLSPWVPKVAGPVTIAPSPPEEDLKDHQRYQEGDAR